MSQKIDTVNPLLSARLSQYSQVRDFLEGAEALRSHDFAVEGAADKAYIPRLKKQDNDAYAAYLRRGLYYNAVGRTRDGFLGLIFERDPVVDLGTAEVLREDADLQGTPLVELFEETIEEVLATARYGWLVDRPEPAPNASKLDAEREGIRPYLVPYKNENIINWSIVRIGTRWKLGRVVLRESYIKDGKAQTRYRELFLDEAGIYTVRIWNRADEQSEYVPDPEVTPRLKNEPIREIPFFFFDPRGGRPDPEKSPLGDIVEVARSHYQTSVDLEHARFTCSVPTPYFLGFTEEEAESIVLGGLNGIQSTNADANVGYLEYTGQGIVPLENALVQKEAMMAKLGTRMLVDEKRSAETAETARIRASGENATLADIAKAVARIAAQALSFVARWMGSETPVTVELNTNYVATGADASEISALLEGVISGKIAQRDFNARLREVGIIKPERTDEDIEADLEAAENQKDAAAEASLSAAVRSLNKEPVA